jgi:hypothetical protein
MTPQEKAQELWSKYRPIIAGKQFVTGVVLMYESNELTKQCALIAVDEILDWTDGQDTLIWLNDFYIEVKHEITQL